MPSCYLCTKELGDAGLENHLAGYDELEYAIGTKSFIELLESPEYRDKPLFLCDACRARVRQQRRKGKLVGALVLAGSAIFVLVCLVLVVRAFF